MYLKSNPAKFHPDPIWNNEALGFFEEGRPNKKKNKMSSDMRSVPDLDTVIQSHNEHKILPQTFASDQLK